MAFGKRLASCTLGALMAIAAVANPLVAGAAQVFVDPIFDVNVTHGVQYGSNVNGFGGTVDLFLDVYEPTGAGVPAERPAIVMMHGGFFINGDSSGMTVAPTEFAKRGYTAVSINYRLLADLAPPPGAPITPVVERYPSYLEGMLTGRGYTFDQYLDTIAAAIEDQATAVNGLAATAATYSVNPDWIAAGGYSAGAVSSLALGAGALDGVSADVGAVFSIAGGLFGQEAFFVDAGDPGVFLLHGDQDTTVPFDPEYPTMVAALTAAGVPFESLVVAGEDHSITPLYNALFADPDPLFEFMANQMGVPIPEPSSVVLAALGIAGWMLLAVRRTRRG